ncbi:unnamed protein product [Rotaria sp. Silwood2]|nr:unnamed protein product [Rotaria sp. Silwood2]
MFEFRLPIRLRTITIDFELAVYNVFTKNYPTVIVRGCLFHYGQSLFRKFVDLGLKTAYKNDENLREWFRSFAALSLEGRHSRLKKHVNAPHPNIYVAIDLLQKEQSLASISRLRDNIGAPTPKRRKNKVITDECLIKLWQRYDDGRLDIPSFLKAAGLRYFQRPPKS